MWVLVPGSLRGLREPGYGKVSCLRHDGYCHQRLPSRMRATAMRLTALSIFLLQAKTSSFHMWPALCASLTEPRKNGAEWITNLQNESKVNTRGAISDNNTLTHNHLNKKFANLRFNRKFANFSCRFVFFLHFLTHNFDSRRAYFDNINACRQRNNHVFSTATVGLQEVAAQ